MAHLDLQTGTFRAAETLLGGRSSRIIGHNTSLHRYSGPADASTLLQVRYHSTDIYSMSADGWITLDTGGWSTVTTWQRINALLPAPWGVSSDRGVSSLYRSGRKITPYVDGLSIHPASGAVGMSGEVLLTADDIAAIAAAADVAAAERATKRAARIVREHPALNGPRTHRGYDHRAYDCERCQTENAAIRAAERATLAAEHAATLAMRYPWTAAEYAAAGSHVTRTVTRTYPFILPPAVPKYDGERDYSAEPVIGEDVKVACPWSCPNRTGY